MSSQASFSQIFGQTELLPSHQEITSFFHTPLCSSLPSRGVHRSSKANKRSSPYPRPPISNPTHRGRSPTLHPRSVHFHQHRSDSRGHRSRESTPSAGLGLVLAVNPTSIPQDDDPSEPGSEEEELIRKPPGEAGRKRRGGYNLERQLAWSESQYKDVRVRV